MRLCRFPLRGRRLWPDKAMKYFTPPAALPLPLQRAPLVDWQTQIHGDRLTRHIHI